VSKEYFWDKLHPVMVKDKETDENIKYTFNSRLSFFFEEEALT